MGINSLTVYVQLKFTAAKKYDKHADLITHCIIYTWGY